MEADFGEGYKKFIINILIDNKMDAGGNYMLGERSQKIESQRANNNRVLEGQRDRESENQSVRVPNCKSKGQ